jgi:uncharacterized protein involved in exopolysaccharide biosynthesis
MTRPQPQRTNIIDAKDLRSAIRIVSKNWYIVVVALGLSAVLSFLYSYRLPDVYGASTQILLKGRDTYDYQSQMYKNLGYVGIYGDIVNQKRVLTSHDLINTALDKLDFDVSYWIVGRFKTSQVYGTLPFTVRLEPLDPDLYERPFDMKILSTDTFQLDYEGGNGPVQVRLPFNKEVMTDHFLIEVTRSSFMDEASLDRFTASDYRFVRHQRSRLIGRMVGGMTIKNHDYTTILEVSVEDEVPLRAKRFLDTLSRVYIDYTLQSEFEINENTLAYIDKQLEEVTAILSQHEDEIERYRENKGILHLGREEGIYFNELVDYDHKRRQMELEIGALDDLESYVLSNENEKLLPPAVYITNDQFLKQTLTELYSMQLNRANMLYSGTPRNQGVLRLDSTIQATRRDLLTYISNAREAIKSRIVDVSSHLADYEEMIRQLPKNQRDILNMQRQLQVNEKMYLFLLEKRASTVIARAGIVPTTKVIESARILGVVRPDKTRILYIFLVGGLVVSMLVVFVRVMFYDRIENADQLKEVTSIPVFGEIIASDKAEENYVVVDSDPKAAITESFRTVRTNMEYLPGEPGMGKVIMVTSYRPNEGKTFCSVNLSAILAKAGKRVLLLEFDLHKPKVGAGLGLSSPGGLSNILIGKENWRDMVLRTQFDDFDVILSGPTPPNASELVLSKYLQPMIAEARQEYDYIVIDTPPMPCS